MTWDVVVVGGGPAGAIAATVLARAGRRVVLVDDAPADVRVVGESLPAIAGHLLGELGLRHLLDGHAPAFGNLSSWGGEELAVTDFIQDPHGHGWHLDRARFNAELRVAAASAGAERRQTRVREVQRGPEGWTLRCGDGSAVERAACVVDATGRRATIARRSGAARTRDDDLIALCAWTRPAAAPAASADTRTLVEATPIGWWYTAPLPGGAHVAALHVREADARAIVGDEGRWSAALAQTRHVSARLAGLRFDAPPQATEACGSRLDAFVGRGWIATGDAALAFDPIAAQGLFNALYTGLKAGRAVDAALRGDPAELAAYTRRLEEVRAAYLQRHGHVYLLEERFGAEPFWSARRRHEMAPAGARG